MLRRLGMPLLALELVLAAVAFAQPDPGSGSSAPMLVPPLVPGLRIPGRIRPELEETVVATGLDSPVSMAFAPDGRLFVCEQRGALRVIAQDRLLERAFVSVPTRADVEEGLLGVAIDPGFATNGWVYLLYTALEPFRHDRIVRYTASGDTALAGSERVVFELDANSSHQHLGGALQFGPDSRLYVGTGDNDIEALSQSLGSTSGKLLRLEPDGRIPADNPFVHTTRGRYGAIWARGFRNVFAIDFDPRGRMFIHDVGASAFEEIDEGFAGANYGWPLFEGPSADTTYRFPLHAYSHRSGCAITGGAFYSPARPALPAEWVGRHLFSDFCANEVRWIDPAAPGRSGVLGQTLVPGPVGLRISPDGALYVLARGSSDPVGGKHTISGLVERIVARQAPGAAAPAR